MLGHLIIKASTAFPLQKTVCLNKCNMLCRAETFTRYVSFCGKYERNIGETVLLSSNLNEILSKHCYRLTLEVTHKQIFYTILGLKTGVSSYPRENILISCSYRDRILEASGLQSSS